MAKSAQAYVAEFNISLAPMNIIGRLVPVRRTGSTKESALVNICPKCENAVKPSQFYQCPNHPEPLYKQGELAKAKEKNKTLIKVDADEAAAARASVLPLNYLELSVHPTEQVEQATYAGEHSYIFYPKVANQQYSVLAELVANPEFALIGTANVKHHEHLLRLERWHEFLIVQTLLYPEDLNETVETPIEYTDEFMSTILQFAEKSLRAFDPEDYKNGIKARVAALTAAIESGDPIPAIERKSDDTVALEQLQAWLNSDNVKV